MLIMVWVFLSTLPARGATPTYADMASAIKFLSTLPARGATLDRQREAAEKGISIHAPREGSDKRCLACQIRAASISIHAPREGSDVKFLRCPSSDLVISIHAPREGSDTKSKAATNLRLYFYPRSPRGERLKRLMMLATAARFLSTLPARGATVPPRASASRMCYFYPRSPRGERRPAGFAAVLAAIFLSTLPARGATLVLVVVIQRIPISIHAPREGSDVSHAPKVRNGLDFYPRSPRGERLYYTRK